MQSFRIGKTLKIRWAILSGGAPEPLAGRDLTLEISSGNRVRTILPFVADGNVAVFYYQGRDQRFTGTYTVTMWENYAKEGQTVVDRCDAFALVPSSCEEIRTTASDIGEGELEIEPAELEIGVPGMSAYELYIKHNPDSELTEEEYAEAPVQVAGVALAMIEQLEETDAAVKQAEQLREQAEQGREASEQARVTAEQARVTAEQQRTLAEQTRVTNESSRQTAETGRQAAETKREENTSEAIRNCESATQKAEDEAARVRTLADNPPKIVEVDGVRYWAFWNEATGQYVVSENRADVGDAVLFSAQELNAEQRAQAQTNIGVKSAVDVVGAGEAQDIQMDVAVDGKYINKRGQQSANASYFISNPYKVDRGDLIIGSVTAFNSVIIISEVAEDGSFIQQLLVGNGASSTKNDVLFLANKNMYVAFSASKTSFSLKHYSCALAKLVAEPSGSYISALLEASGATWDTAKGVWLLNELELTNGEIASVISAAISPSICISNGGVYGENKTIRTNLPCRLSASYMQGTCTNIYHSCSNIEITNTVGTNKVVTVSDVSYAYSDCPKLRKELSILDVRNITSFTDFIRFDTNVESIRLKNLKANLDYSPSAKINYECLKYIIDNAANTSAITITVHPTTYGYLTGITEPTEQVGGTAEEWQALVATAQEKQISFASA